jgi:non-canonical purine NTP pyrophosphatase (RdgB/HAM1 family)
MQTITFVTSNPGKVASLQRRLAPLAITVEHFPLNLLESQAESSQKVARHKAYQAYQSLKRPVVIEDSSFHIPTLNNFPGAYVKYILQTIGARGLLQLLQHQTKRDAYFLGTLVYIENKTKLQTFTEHSWGTITTSFERHSNTESWSELWNIFIPRGSTKPLSQLTGTERDTLYEETEHLSRFGQFAQFLNQ